jgi:hypothetical protein
LYHFIFLLRRHRAVDFYLVLMSLCFHYLCGLFCLSYHWWTLVAIYAISQKRSMWLIIADSELQISNWKLWTVNRKRNKKFLELGSWFRIKVQRAEVLQFNLKKHISPCEGGDLRKVVPHLCSRHRWCRESPRRSVAATKNIFDVSGTSSSRLQCYP